MLIVCLNAFLKNITLHLSFAQVKYKEAFEMTKAKGYTIHPEGVNFVNSRKAHKICNDVRRHSAAVFTSYKFVLMDLDVAFCVLFFY